MLDMTRDICTSPQSSFKLVLVLPHEALSSLGPLIKGNISSPLCITPVTSNLLRRCRVKNSLAWRPGGLP